MKLNIDRYINTANVKEDANKAVTTTKREVKGFASRVKAASEGASTAWKTYSDPDPAIVELVEDLEAEEKGEGTYVKAQAPIDLIAKELKKSNEKIQTIIEDEEL